MKMNFSDFKEFLIPLLTGWVARMILKGLAATSLSAGFLSQTQTEKLSAWIVCGALTLVEAGISWYKHRQAEHMKQQLSA